MVDAVLTGLAYAYQVLPEVTALRLNRARARLRRPAHPLQVTALLHQVRFHQAHHHRAVARRLRHPVHHPYPPLLRLLR